ncbi:hypothetical protein LTS10_006411 [Elasticomyces elasticus]|nr:hypothetical protein LTS10_006411 [Elasticomyces elasticus]
MGEHAQEQEQHEGDKWKEYNLLNFDGGGIRRYWKLVAARKLMKRMKHAQAEFRNSAPGYTTGQDQDEEDEEEEWIEHNLLTLDSSGPRDFGSSTMSTSINQVAETALTRTRAALVQYTHPGPRLQYEPRISGQLGHVEVSCLADRGAGRNIISRANEREVYDLEFYVMPNCVQDIILGSPFLRLTQTFERFAHRIHRRLRQCLPNRMQYMGSAERVLGTLNGSLVDALPDTGSDVMLISEAYARQRGFSVDRNPIYHVPLQLGDGSFDRTSGIVKDATWAYGVAEDEVSLCDFYVLENLSCDVLLSYDFLDSTEAFTRQSSWFQYDQDDVEADDRWTLNTITKVPEFMQRLRQRLSSKSIDAPRVNAARTPQEVLQDWEREKRRLLRAFEMNEAQVMQLPLEQQDTARAAYAAILQPAYDKHMQSRPGS